MKHQKPKYSPPSQRPNYRSRLSWQEEAWILATVKRLSRCAICGSVEHVNPVGKSFASAGICTKCLNYDDADMDDPRCQALIDLAITKAGRCEA
jgi:hypothetical protein